MTAGIDVGRRYAGVPLLSWIGIVLGAAALLRARHLS